MEVRRLAIAADISTGSAERTCGMLGGMGYETVSCSDGARAVSMCIERHADVLVIDSVMPSADGKSAALTLRRAYLDKYPAVIISCYPGMVRLMPEDMPGIARIEKPVEAESLRRAVYDTEIVNRRMNSGVERILDRILNELGVPEHPGRDCLRDAAFLAREDRSLLTSLTGRLYPAVASRMGISPVRAERAMRRVIETAWSTGDIDKQYEIFRGTVDAARGKPTCGAMIARLSDMLRMEDRK